ncbi:MAG: DUF4278 domain-containing protein [Cyanobacteria bacterium]|nr:DUF4278 domain-containing protein [Cyanobacteriota bacterium]
MRLTYRGISYTPTAPSVQWRDRPETCTYRGLTYHPREAESIPPQPQLALTYRGIPYQTDAAGRILPREDARTAKRLTPIAPMSTVARTHRDAILRRLEQRIAAAKRQGNTHLLVLLEQERQQLA